MDIPYYVRYRFKAGNLWYFIAQPILYSQSVSKKLSLGKSIQQQ